MTFPVRVLLPALLCLYPILADSWKLPTRQKYYSANRLYRLEVIPKGLASPLSYFSDKVDGVSNAGAKDKSAAPTARAVFAVRGPLGFYRRTSAFPLVNEVSPVNALVSADGRYVATFDNWHSLGYGGDAVVLYRSDGTLIRRFGLEDLLTADDLEVLPRTVSSIWWGGDHDFNSKDQLVLRIVSNEKTPWETGAQFREIAIDLSTGKPVKAKRNLFPNAHRVPSVRIHVPPDTALTTSIDPSTIVCTADRNVLPQRLASEDLVRGLESSVRIEYPPLAKQARIQGTVVADLSFDAVTGKVACACVRSGHKLFHAATLKALSSARIEPSRISSAAMYSILIEFKLGPR